tara:strand:- start:8094 stop:8375 length:282 start_codon:yes stop_codon:yes gene_type:complete
VAILTLSAASALPANDAQPLDLRGIQSHLLVAWRNVDHITTKLDASLARHFEQVDATEKCALAGAGTAQIEITSPSWASSDKPFKTSKDPKDL